MRHCVSVTLTIVIGDDPKVNGVEAAIHRAWKDFPSAAWQAVVNAVEEGAEAQHEGRLRRKGSEGRQLWTTAGWVRFWRQRYWERDAPKEKSFLLFDQRVGLEAKSRCTDAVGRMTAEVAALGVSYSRSSELLRRIYGDAPSSWAVWQRLQEEGRRLREEDILEHRRIFMAGDLPGQEVPPKELVVVEADGTKVHAWKQKNVHHDMYLGVMYEGKEQSGRRRRLVGKAAVSQVGQVKAFGERLWIEAQKRYNVIEAKEVLFCTDGEAGLEAIRQMHFTSAEHQLDLAHVTRSVYRAYGAGREAQAKNLLACVWEEDRAGFDQQLQSDQRAHPDRAPSLQEAKDYIGNRWNQLFAYRRLRKRLPAEAWPTHMAGTGAEERNIGTLVGHRMKHRGMGWSRNGAANLMRVRLRALNLQN